MLPTGKDNEKKEHRENVLDLEAQPQDTVKTGQSETIIVKPRLSDTFRVVLSPQTAFHVLTYMNSFGGELSINTILASYYFKNFPHFSQTTAANRAAMFGFLNFATRPLGGVVSDLLYKYSGGNLWLKKGWIVACGLAAGTLLIVVGRLDPHDESTMVGLITLVAVFLQAGNGANFSLVPHVHPSANGVLSGLTGAGGNLGGILFSLIFRFMDNGTDYAKGLWVIGLVHFGVSLAVSWILLLPKGRINEH